MKTIRTHHTTVWQVLRIDDLTFYIHNSILNKLLAMNSKDFKCIVGEAGPGKPAVIRFYGAVYPWSAEDFIREFLFLQDVIKPSKIIILINSEGGEVVPGMSVFSVINSCPIETNCVVEGIAASMGSIIWAAGDKLFMRDYSLLMIHNPFVPCEGEDDAYNKCKPDSKCKPDDECDPDGKCKPDGKCNPDDECDPDGKCKPDSKCKPDDKCNPDDECDPDDKCKPDGKCKPDSKCKPDDECDPDDKCKPKGECDPSTKNMLDAFKTQLETIYVKRFGLSKEKVRSIMDGEDGADGTWFTAREAVKAGIFPESNIISTCEQERAEMEAAMRKQCKNSAKIYSVAARLIDKDKENKHISETLAILEQNDKKPKNNITMNEKELAFDAICAQLGLAKDTPVASVVPRLSDLIKGEGELKTVQSALGKAQAELGELKIQYKGKEAEVQNLTEKLNDVEGKLKAYQEAEAAQKEAHIKELVKNAVDAGKIGVDDQDEWVALAQANLSLVEKTLAGITPRDKITDVIANDPENVNNADKSINATMIELQQKVKEVVGEVEFKKF